MIPLIRVRTAKSIKAIYRGADKKEKDKELMMAQRLFLNDPLKPVKFNSAFWKKAKVQLKSETNNKCAYCEADTAVVAHGDVEHYRPKSVYWWLAYTYDNYLYSCQICNQSYKGNNFPITGAQYPSPPITMGSSDQQINALAGMISPDPIDGHLDYKLAKFIKEHQSEGVLLINPYFDDPAQLISYEADEVKREVIIKPRIAAYAPFIDAMESYYGLNRIELNNLRFAAYETFVLIKRSLPYLPANLRTAALKQIDYFISPRAPFSGMHNYFNAII